MTVQIDNPNPTFFDKDTNLPLAGGYVYFYVAGTTTPAPTYSDSALSVLNTSPYIELSAAGNFTNPVFLPAITYKIAVYSAGGIASGTLQWTRDNYDVISPASFSASQTTNTQTGTTYTIQTTDLSKKIIQSNINAIATALPQAGTNFPDGWFTTVTNKGAGLVTITATTSTINGLSTLELTRGMSALITSDGTDYWADITGEPVGSRKAWYSSTPPHGWLIENGNSIGDATSGATKAAEIYRALYQHLYAAVSDSYAPVTGGRVAVNTDFDAHKKLTMATMVDMSPYGVGTYAAGQNAGAATVISTGTIGTSGATTLSASTIPALTYSIGLFGSSGSSSGAYIANTTASNSTNATATGAVSTNASGGSHTHTSGTFTGDATSVLHPVRGTYWIIKY